MIHGAVLQRQAVVHRIDERPAVVKDHEFKKVNDEACALPVELPRDRQLGGSRVSSRHREWKR